MLHIADHVFMSNSEEKNDLAMSSYRDSCMLFFDCFKHLTTLSTGSIVILVTFMTKVLELSASSYFVATMLWALAVSILSSVFAMFVFASHIQGRVERTKSNVNLITAASLLAGGGFVVGLSSLVWAVTSGF